MDYDEPMSSKRALLDHLQYEVGVLQEPRLREAFEQIDRADFVPEEYRPEVYEDYALPIAEGQTISQPTTIAFMLEKLGVELGDRVLDIGSGSGWSTALLAYLVGSDGRVIGKEFVPDLASYGRANCAAYGFENVRIDEAGDELGAPADAPFDKILVSASAEALPETLISQLAPGGRMVIPLEQSLAAVEKHKDGSIEQHTYPGFVFVPLQ